MANSAASGNSAISRAAFHYGISHECPDLSGLAAVAAAARHALQHIQGSVERAHDRKIESVFDGAIDCQDRREVHTD